MSKGVYIWIYIGFCFMVVHFMGSSGYIWLVVGGGGNILAGGGW